VGSEMCIRDRYYTALGSWLVEICTRNCRKTTY